MDGQTGRLADIRSFMKKSKEPDNEILETAQSPKSPFTFWILGLDFGLGLVNFRVSLSRREDADLTPCHLLCSERD